MTQGAQHTGVEARLKRIEGQVRGVSKMVEERRYCIEILQQLTAVRRAVDQVSLNVMKGHINGCVSDAVRKGEGPEKVDELMQVIHRYAK
jgi:CsoR family transcriptional regulator, copper-sensing transcriptional repressor